MTDKVIHLVATGNPPKRACSSCRHIRKEHSDFPICGATGYYIRTERNSEGPCGHQGQLWEQQPPPPPEAPWPGLFVATYRFLFGADKLRAPGNEALHTTVVAFVLMAVLVLIPNALRLAGF